MTTIQVFKFTCNENPRLVQKILEEQLIQMFATLILWVFSEWLPDYDTIRERYLGIKYENGWCETIYDSLSSAKRIFLVLDD